MLKQCTWSRSGLSYHAGRANPCPCPWKYVCGLRINPLRPILGPIVGVDGKGKVRILLMVESSQRWEVSASCCELWSANIYILFEPIPPPNCLIQPMIKYLIIRVAPQDLVTPDCNVSATPSFVITSTDHAFWLLILRFLFGMCMPKLEALTPISYRSTGVIRVFVTHFGGEPDCLISLLAINKAMLRLESTNNGGVT